MLPTHSIAGSIAAAARRAPSPAPACAVLEVDEVDHRRCRRGCAAPAARHLARRVEIDGERGQSMPALRVAVAELTSIAVSVRTGSISRLPPQGSAPLSSSAAAISSSASARSGPTRARARGARGRPAPAHAARTTLHGATSMRRSQTTSSISRDRARQGTSARRWRRHQAGGTLRACASAPQGYFGVDGRRQAHGLALALVAPHLHRIDCALVLVPCFFSGSMPGTLRPISTKAALRLGSMRSTRPTIPRRSASSSRAFPDRLRQPPSRPAEDFELVLAGLG